MAVAQHVAYSPISQKVKGQGHTVASDYIVHGWYRVTLQVLLRPLPAWVCMSIRLPMFSGV